MPRAAAPPTGSTTCCAAPCTCSSTSSPTSRCCSACAATPTSSGKALSRRRAFDRRVTALVSEAQAEGSLRSDIDVRIVERLLFGMINSIVEWYRPGGPEDADTLADDVIAVALDGLRMPTSNRVEELLG